MKKGFTLLELLIVIAIMAILAAVAIFVLNPAETLREARDAQRVSDLATIKTALALYITKSTSTIYLDGNSNINCSGGATPKIFYSVPSSETTITSLSVGDGATYGTTAFAQATTTASSTLVDGSGWIRVNLDSLIGGSPISNFPVDPTNTLTAATVASSSLTYRYACKTNSTFEINAQLESDSLGARRAKDGGNNSNFYEVGTNLTILAGGGGY